MPINIKSLQGRLLNITREKKLDFQMLLNRLAAEQFLYRLSQSSHVDKFVFKGGSPSVIFFHKNEAKASNLYPMNLRLNLS